MADTQSPKEPVPDSSFKLSKLNFFDLANVKEVEEKNRLRVEKLMRQRRNNRITLGILSFSVLSIYGYTFYSIKQENFLDDFNEPEKIHD